MKLTFMNAYVLSVLSSGVLIGTNDIFQLNMPFYLSCLPAICFFITYLTKILTNKL